MQIPMIHLLILLKNAVNFPIFNSLVRFVAIDRTKIHTVIGNTTEWITVTILLAKKATAGRHTAAVDVPPLAAISVKINGKINCICVCIEDIPSTDNRKHSLKTVIKGINAAA